MKIGTGNWGNQFLGNLKEAAYKAKAKTDKLVEGFKSETDSKPQGDTITISDQKPAPEDIKPQDNNPEKGITLTKEGKGAIIGGTAALLMGGGLVGIGAAAWFGKEVAEHGLDGALEVTGKQMGKASNAVQGWFKETFGSENNVQTNTSTIEVQNGAAKATVATNNVAGSKVPQTLTILE